MAAAVRVRGDYDAGQLRELAKRSDDADQTRRLLALAAVYDGGSRTEAAKIGGVGLQTVRDWVLAFNAEGPSGLVDGKAPGNPPLLSDQQRRALMRIVEAGPIPAAHGVVRWRLIDLVQWVFDEFGVSEPWFKKWRSDAVSFMRTGTRGSPSWPGLCPETGYVDADCSDQIAQALADGAGHTFLNAASASASWA